METEYKGEKLKKARAIVVFSVVGSALFLSGFLLGGLCTGSPDDIPASALEKEDIKITSWEYSILPAQGPIPPNTEVYYLDNGKITVVNEGECPFHVTKLLVSTGNETVNGARFGPGEQSTVAVPRWLGPQEGPDKPKGVQVKPGESKSINMHFQHKMSFSFVVSEKLFVIEEDIIDKIYEEDYYLEEDEVIDRIVEFLDENKIAPELRELFKEKGYSLSGDVSVSVRLKHRIWRLKDRTRMYRFEGRSPIFSYRIYEYEGGLGVSGNLIPEDPEVRGKFRLVAKTPENKKLVVSKTGKMHIKSEYGAKLAWPSKE